MDSTDKLFSDRESALSLWQRSDSPEWLISRAINIKNALTTDARRTGDSEAAALEAACPGRAKFRIAEVMPTSVNRASGHFQFLGNRENIAHIAPESRRVVDQDVFKRTRRQLGCCQQSLKSVPARPAGA